jgi:hypothetical protein
MKRLTILLTGVLMVGAVALAAAGDFHYGTSLICSDCHTAHFSQQHGYTTTGIFTPLGAAGPYDHLLRNDEVNLCLSCHNGTSFAPDVFGANGGTQGLREAGGLNAAAGHGLSNDAGYDEINGHTLYSMAMPPGGAASGYVPATDGLWCGSCHSVHGKPTYRNLSNSGKFAGDTLTYAVGTNDLTKDIFERSAGVYTESNIDFNRPDVHGSKYGAWCQDCHTDFHGAAGSANMGGGASPWKRHPVADLNMSSGALGRWTTLTNKVKVMDPQGLWLGTGTDNQLTPSCMSCHKAHGNKNAFGLIYMNGTGTRSEEGDGGVFKDLCRQCHRQGA